MADVEAGTADAVYEKEVLPQNTPNKTIELHVRKSDVKKKKTVMIAVDSSASASRAVKAALKTLDKANSQVILMHIYSPWDYLNDEKNEGKLALEHQRAICEQMGYHVVAIQKEAEVSPQEDFCTEAAERGVDEFWIGENSFIEVANPDNWVYWFFSVIKRKIVGTMAQYVKANCKCKVIVVPDEQIVLE